MPRICHPLSYLCAGAVIAVLLGASNGAANEDEDEVELKGVFTGSHVGCKTKEDLLAYYEAEEAGNQTATGKLIAQRTCLQLQGRTYVPLRMGFVTARVRVTYQGNDIEMWTRSAAVVESPPPARQSHFNF